MDKKLKETKSYYYDHYFSNDTAKSIEDRVFEKLQVKPKKQGFGKKVFYFSSAAVILIGLLIGSAFTSPAIANVLAQIPVLNGLFEKGSDSSLVGSIVDELQDEGYKVGGASLHVRTKTIGIEIDGSESYYKEVKEEVKRKVINLLEAKGVDAYKVDITLHKEPVDPESEMTTEQIKQMEAYQEQSQQLQKAILEKMEKEGYEILSANVRINDIERFIPLEIPITETRIDEMKAIARDLAEETELGDFKIKVYKIDPEKQKAEQRWMPVISAMGEGLIGMEELKVEGFAYSFYPSPLTFSIRTSIEADQKDAKQLAAEIEKEARQFIESDEVKENVKDDEYVINIYSKDEEILNH
ncbi:DUF4030 domain-containing protein [Sediminibacillus terrae]|uniref:DUF4030 domain-containing protein n=1 Tax=Sediminibacillus terrae TaxID=1562106 RepID=UPI001294F973|nr:DUF4030 domain-containing protein [Sediminibacillus terrae]